MSRKKHIDWLSTQGTTNTDIQTLEELAGESDMLHDAVFLITSRVISTDDDSYDFVAGTHFPVQIQLDHEGFSVLAPCIFAYMPGAPEVVRDRTEWEELTDVELEQLRLLIPDLQKQYHPLAEVQLDEAVKAQARLISYSVRFRVEGTKEEAAMVIWDGDIPELEQHIRDQFGDRLISLKSLGPMKNL